MVHESGNAYGGPHTVDVPKSVTPGVDVFISYGSDDVDLAREMRGHLEEGGYRCWMAPDDVSGPKTWAEQILDAISSCKVALVLISSVANASNHVSKEVDLALEHGKAVLPVRIEDVAPSGALRYLLALAQWIDAFPGPLGPHAEEVRRRVAAIVGGDTEIEVTPPGAVTPPSPEKSTEATRPSGKRGAPPPWRKWLIATLAAVILAGVGMGIGLVVAGGDDGTPYTYGDDEALDRWWDRCENGDLSGCDRLFADAPFDTEYSYFGETCGERTDGGGECAIGDEQGDSYTYGDNAELDRLWDGCSAEEFDACDALYEQSPAGSEYEVFGWTCGFRVDEGGNCVQR